MTVFKNTLGITDIFWGYFVLKEHSTNFTRGVHISTHGDVIVMSLWCHQLCFNFQTFSRKPALQTLGRGDWKRQRAGVLPGRETLTKNIIELHYGGCIIWSLKSLSSSVAIVKSIYHFNNMPDNSEKCPISIVFSVYVVCIVFTLK